MQPIQQHHRISHIANPLILRARKTKVDQRPRHNPGSSIMEKLEIEPLPNPRIEFDTHVQVVDRGGGEFAVFGVGGEEVGFDVAEEGEEVAVDVGGDEEGAPVVVDNGGAEEAEAEVRESDEEGVGDEPDEEAVDLVIFRSGEDVCFRYERPRMNLRCKVASNRRGSSDRTRFCRGRSGSKELGRSTIQRRVEDPLGIEGQN